jgi:hypothetical protein
MDFLYWYFGIILLLIIGISGWAAMTQPGFPLIAQRLRFFTSMCTETMVSGVAYWCLVFVLALAIATALWLILMLLIWVPSDFFRNYAGLDLFSAVLNNIKPFLYRSPSSPGITAIPLLDYVSLYSAFVFGPWFAVWSITSKYQQRKNITESSPESS